MKNHQSSSKTIQGVWGLLRKQLQGVLHWVVGRTGRRRRRCTWLSRSLQACESQCEHNGRPQNSEHLHPALNLVTPISWSPMCWCRSSIQSLPFGPGGQFQSRNTLNMEDQNSPKQIYKGVRVRGSSYANYNRFSNVHYHIEQLADLNDPKIGGTTYWSRFTCGTSRLMWGLTLKLFLSNKSH